MSSLRAFVSPSNWCLTRIFAVFCHIVTLKGLEVTTSILLFSKLYSASLQVTKAYNYIHKHGYKSKLMAAAVRNKQDIFNLLG